MVAVVNKKVVASAKVNLKPSLIIELVGPAGAGKTTLSRALCQRDHKFLIGPDIELRKARHIPVFLRSISSMASLGLSKYRSSRRPTWTELKDIAYLQGWPRLLRRQASNRGKVILLDQGPVFRLATLQEFGPNMLKSEAFEKWWLHLYKEWASTLDLVIWLDTSDAILMKRINTRSKKHNIKGKPDQEAHDFLMRHRRSYSDVLTKLASPNGPTIFQFDTSNVPVEKIVDAILAECRLKLRDDDFGRTV